ncbi:MAG: hypothetical protein ACKPJF_26070 [Dolichospermum sp.]
MKTNQSPTQSTVCQPKSENIADHQPSDKREFVYLSTYQRENVSYQTKEL